MTDVVVTRVIAASPATVFSFFTDIERWVSWQGVEGEIDARAGGANGLGRLGRAPWGQGPPGA